MAVSSSTACKKKRLEFHLYPRLWPPYSAHRYFSAMLPIPLNFQQGRTTSSGRLQLLWGIKYSAAFCIQSLNTKNNLIQITVINTSRFFASLNPSNFTQQICQYNRLCRAEENGFLSVWQIRRQDRTEFVQDKLDNKRGTLRYCTNRGGHHMYSCC